MSIKEGQDFYRSLPRKELQSLCEEYGLPARKSSSEMAESLFSLFQKNGLSFASLGKRKAGTQEIILSPASVTNRQTNAPFSLTENALKDIFQWKSCPREEGNRGYTNTKCNEMESCKGLGAYDKETVGRSIDYFHGSSQSQIISQSADGGFIHETPSSFICRKENTSQHHCGQTNVGVCPIKNASPTRPPASFKFYVSKEEGIKLCVDLDSRPTDWIKKYTNQVSLFKHVDGTTSRSLRQDLRGTGESDNTQEKGSFPYSIDPVEMEDTHVQAKTFPSLVVENNIEIDHPDGGTKLSMILPIISCSADGSEGLEEEQGPISSKPSADVQNQIISIAESCPKNDHGAMLDSDITDTPTEKTACNFDVNSRSNVSGELIVIEHQISEPDDEICENLTPHNSSDLENNSIVFPGCLAICSSEMQLSESGNNHKDTSCSPNKNGELLGLDDSNHKIGNEQAALATSNENEHCGNCLPACS